MANGRHITTGLVFLLIGTLLLISHLWLAPYGGAAYLITSHPILIAGILIGFGLREALLELLLKQHNIKSN